MLAAHISEALAAAELSWRHVAIMTCNYQAGAFDGAALGSQLAQTVAAAVGERRAAPQPTCLPVLRLMNAEDGMHDCVLRLEVMALA